MDRKYQLLWKCGASADYTAACLVLFSMKLEKMKIKTSSTRFIPLLWSITPTVDTNI
jgi:hypothetical protein